MSFALSSYAHPIELDIRFGSPPTEEEPPNLSRLEYLLTKPLASFPDRSYAFAAEIEYVFGRLTPHRNRILHMLDIGGAPGGEVRFYLKQYPRLVAYGISPGLYKHRRPKRFIPVMGPDFSGKIASIGPYVAELFTELKVVLHLVTITYSPRTIWAALATAFRFLSLGGRLVLRVDAGHFTKGPYWRDLCFLLASCFSAISVAEAATLPGRGVYIVGTGYLTEAYVNHAETLAGALVGGIPGDGVIESFVRSPLPEEFLAWFGALEVDRARAPVDHASACAEVQRFDIDAGVMSTAHVPSLPMDAPRVVPARERGQLLLHVVAGAPPQRLSRATEDVLWDRYLHALGAEVFPARVAACLHAWAGAYSGPLEQVKDAIVRYLADTDAPIEVDLRCPPHGVITPFFRETFPEDLAFGAIPRGDPLEHFGYVYLGETEDAVRRFVETFTDTTPPLFVVGLHPESKAVNVYPWRLSQAMVRYISELVSSAISASERKSSLSG